MSKRALSAKLDDSLLSQTDQLVKLFKIPRNRALEEGLRLWVDLKSRELLARKMKEASLAVRKESLKNAGEWDEALQDGLGDD